jgi:hypothetical protein
MNLKKPAFFPELFFLSFFIFLFSVIPLKGFSLGSLVITSPASTPLENVFIIAILLCIWFFIPLIATVIISILAFRISPNEESVEATGENSINILPGLKFKAKGAVATFLILIALSSLIIIPPMRDFITPLPDMQRQEEVRNIIINHNILDESAVKQLSMSDAIKHINDYLEKVEKEREQKESGIKNIIVHHSILDESAVKQLSMSDAIKHINDYLEKVEKEQKGLEMWTLGTKIAIFDPKVQGSKLMDDREVMQIMNKDTLKVRIDDVPLVKPDGTRVIIKELLYLPIGIKNIDDVKDIIDNKNIDLEFEVQKSGDESPYKRQIDLATLGRTKRLKYVESNGAGPLKTCDINQQDFLLSVNFQEKMMWIGACTLLE